MVHAPFFLAVTIPNVRNMVSSSNKTEKDLSMLMIVDDLHPRSSWCFSHPFPHDPSMALSQVRRPLLSSPTQARRLPVFQHHDVCMPFPFGISAAFLEVCFSSDLCHPLRIAQKALSSCCCRHRKCIIPPIFSPMFACVVSPAAKIRCKFDQGGARACASRWIRYMLGSCRSALRMRVIIDAIIDGRGRPG
jgi:hypothetical protein